MDRSAILSSMLARWIDVARDASVVVVVAMFVLCLPLHGLVPAVSATTMDVMHMQGASMQAEASQSESSSRDCSSTQYHSCEMSLAISVAISSLLLIAAMVVCALAFFCLYVPRTQVSRFFARTLAPPPKYNRWLALHTTSPPNGWLFSPCA